VFKKAEGLTWLDTAGRTFTLSWSEFARPGGRARPSRAHRPQGLPALQQVWPRVLSTGQLSSWDAKRRRHNATAIILMFERIGPGLNARRGKPGVSGSGAVVSGKFACLL